MITVDYAIPSMNYIGVYIDTVEFGKVLASYSIMDWGPTYVDHTKEPFQVYRGETYQLKVRHWNGWDDPNYKYQRVWIDWDGSGRLDDDELVLDGLDNIDVTIPADATLGEVRMRVIARWSEPTSLSAQEAIDDGEVEDYTMVIGEISAGVPVADFEADTLEGCAGGFVVEYTDLSTNTPTSWSWTFEGGTPATSELQNPVVAYEDAGVYDVSLTATQPSGSGDEAKTDFITINALPDVSGGGDMNTCFGAEITLSGSGADTYTWDNGVTDGVAFVPTSGDYAVWGTDAQGCMNTDTIAIAVAAEIDASVTATETVLTANSADGTGMVNVYPNPSTGKVNVALETTGARMKVYDITGAVILERMQTSDVEQIDISAKGMYILRVEAEGAVYTGKLVIE
jgi:PKD repeat protein